MRFVGLDLHKQSVEACALSAKGKVVFRLSVACRRDALEAFAREHLRPTDRVAVEAESVDALGRGLADDGAHAAELAEQRGEGGVGGLGRVALVGAEETEADVDAVFAELIPVGFLDAEREEQGGEDQGGEGQEAGEGLHGPQRSARGGGLPRPRWRRDGLGGSACAASRGRAMVRP